MTHIVLSVAERETGVGLVTKVEEPPATPKAAKKKAGEPPAPKMKVEEPKAEPKAAKTTEKKAAKQARGF